MKIYILVTFTASVFWNFESFINWLSWTNDYLVSFKAYDFQDNEQDDENQLHAVKILEVLILQCGSAIKEAFPHILSLAVHRLSQPFENGLHDLKAMLTLVGYFKIFIEGNKFLEIFFRC